MSRIPITFYTGNKQNAFREGKSSGKYWERTRERARKKEHSVARCECSRVANIGKRKRAARIHKITEKAEKAERKRERETLVNPKAREVHKSRDWSFQPHSFSENFALIKENLESFSSFTLSLELPHWEHSIRCNRIYEAANTRFGRESNPATLWLDENTRPKRKLKYSFASQRN